jgi:hypothetical protein
VQSAVKIFDLRGLCLLREKHPARDRKSGFHGQHGVNIGLLAD